MMKDDGVCPSVKSQSLLSFVMVKRSSKKRRKSQRQGVPKEKPLERGQLTIELEPNAQELFLDSLEDIPPQAHKDKGDFDRVENRPAKKKGSGVREIEIDLHGFTVVEAKSYLESTVRQHLKREPITFKVITGKGLHSGPSGGVLAGAMHMFVLERFGHLVSKIDESPEGVKVRGVPIRGHFCVTMRKK